MRSLRWLAHIPLLPALAAAYITAQRKRYTPRSHPLSPEQIRRMAPFFSLELLHSVRVAELGRERIKEPAVFAVARRFFVSGLPALNEIAAITFVDLIVSQQPLDPSLLFHELVHVAQYRRLGVRSFARLYVTGFFRSGTYAGIPLESQAFELGCRFELDPGSAFSVEEDVALRIAADHF